MKKGLTLLVALVLALLIGVSSALSAPGDRFVLDARETGETFFGTSMVSIDGTLFYLRQGEGFYCLKPDEEEPTKLIDLAVEQQPAPFDQYGSLIGSDALYCMTSESLWRYDADAAAFVEVEGVDFSALDEYNESDDYYVNEFQVFGDHLYYLRLHMMMGGRDLMKLDLKTGKESKAADYVWAFTPYRDGKMLIVTLDDRYERELSIFDPATGHIEKKLKLNDSYEPLYDEQTDFIYLIGNGIRRSKGFGEPELAAYLPLFEDSSASETALLPGGMVAVNYGSRVYLCLVDPAFKPQALKIAGSLGEMYYEYERYAHQNPGVPIELMDSPGEIDQIMLEMASDSAGDLYTYETWRNDLTTLYEKGYLADLSGDPVIAEAVARMSPYVRLAVTRGDVIIAVPYQVDTGSSLLFAYAPEVVEDLGLTDADMPKTYAQFFDFIARWQTELSFSHPQWPLLDNMDMSMLRDAILRQMILDQVMLSEVTGEVPRFDTPEFLALIEKFCATDFTQTIPQPRDQMDTHYGIPTSIFTRYSLLVDNNWQRGFQVMPLSLNDDVQPVVELNISLVTLNPVAKNFDVALDFLRFFATDANMAQTTRISIFADQNDPVLGDSYDDMVENTKYWLELNQSQYEKADEGDQMEIRQSIDELEQQLLDLELNKYWIRAEQIAVFREMEKYLVTPVQYSAISKYVKFDSYLFRERLLNNNITPAGFVAELDQKIQMMIKEQG